MADRKITDLTALAAGSQATGDLLTIVDVSEGAAADKNKKITVESLFKGIPGDVGISTSSPRSTLHVAGNLTITKASNNPAIVFDEHSGSTDPKAQIQMDQTNSTNASLLFSTEGSGTLSERLRIDSSGNVGIGTSSPDALLEIESSAGGTSFSINNTGTSGRQYILQSTSSSASIGGGKFAIYDGDAPAHRFVLDSSGNVGIGTTSPSGKLNIEGSDSQLLNLVQTSGDLAIRLNDSGVGSAYIKVRDNTGGSLSFDTGGSERMRIDSSGDVMIGTTSNTAHVNADNLIVGSTSGSYQGITINASTGSQIRFADAANNSIGYVIYNHGSNKLEFGVNGAEAMILTKNQFLQTGGYVNNSASYHRINGRDQTQGSNFCVFSGFQTSGGSNGDTAYFYSCNSGASANGSGTAMLIFRNASTSRSINASGTINASGADYAEYMTKAGSFTLAKGDICGINSEGKLTNMFADAISFVVKSTDPSYVGGDTWHTAAGEKPGGAGDDRTEEEIAAATVVYEEALEAARQLVDRIAFSGQVPVNVTGATPGQHIIPTAAADGSIEGTAKAEADLTMAEYMSSVGKVIAIEDDGRAKIIVKVA